jgi:transcriptional regulator with XRE-family HTH domain
MITDRASHIRDSRNIPLQRVGVNPAASNFSSDGTPAKEPAVSKSDGKQVCALRFGAKLAALIKDKTRARSQSALAEATGLKQTAISAMTLGKRRPYADQAFLIARALGVCLDYLLDDSLDEEPPSELTDEERILMKFIRDSGLPHVEVIRRLVQGGGAPTPVAVPPVDLTLPLTGASRGQPKGPAGPNLRRKRGT